MSWTEITDDTKLIEVDCGNIAKLSYARIVLNNKNGQYTSGAGEILNGKYLKIDADVREPSDPDNIFWGKIYRKRGKQKGRKNPLLALHCFGLDKKLMEDTITRDYREEYLDGDDLTMQTVIEDMFANPDSGENTNFVLETDGGLITSTPPLDNFRRTELLKAIQNIADNIGYDGYFYMNGNVPTLYLKAIGTVNPSPAVTLADPFIEINPTFDIENVGNHIFAWGDIDIGFPSTKDEWTENDILTDWAAGSGDTRAVDTVNYFYGAKSVKLTDTDDNNMIEGTFTLPETLDLTNGRFYYMSFMLRYELTQTLRSLFPPQITLTDSSGNKIKHLGGTPTSKHGIWNNYRRPIYHVEIYDTTKDGEWFYDTGSSFNWNLVSINFVTIGTFDITPDVMNIDGLYFIGGLRIDPFKYPVLNPPKYDQPSIDAFGRMVMHVDDPLIRSFNQAQDVATYVLAANKNEMKLVKCKKSAYTWLKANQNVTLTHSPWAISGTWRTIHVHHDWSVKTQVLRTTTELVPYDQKVGSEAYIAESYEGLVTRWK